VAHQEDDIPALFIGGSNADKLANAAASLGVVADTITEGGWILSTSSVSIILPQVEAYCATLPPDAPVVIYCLDNSSFCCADQDGTLSAIAKDKSDNKYHVVGELVVVHEITMAAAVTNLKRLLAICGDRKVFIITPCLRYANASCCSATGHCVHRLIPDFAIRLLEDLRRLHSFFKQRLSSFTNCTVIPAGDLIAGKKDASTSDIIAAYSGWGTVHGSGTSYTRMALYMMDNLFRVPIAKPAPPQTRVSGRAASQTPLPSAPATPVPDPATAVPGRTSAPEATAENAAVTAATAASPASSPVSSAAAPAAALEAALAAASMTAPSGATTTLGAVGTPDTPATDLLIISPEDAPFSFFLYIKKLHLFAQKTHKKLYRNFFLV
jgi:hypothetical protein